MSYRCKEIGRALAAAALALVLMAGWLGVDSAAADVPRKLERQMDIMEEVISEMLVDSPNWLVSWGGPAYGVYLEGYGAVFTFKASLVSSGSSGLRIGSGFLGRILGDHVVIYDDDDEYWDEDDDEWYEDDEAYKKWRSKRREREARRYDRGKDEMREVLADYGATMELADDEWVAITAFLEDHRYFRRSKISRYVLKAKMRDLNQFESGSISMEELESRMIEEVY